MTSRVEELQRMCDNINENGGLDSGEWHTALLAQIAQNLAVIADVMVADRKIENSSEKPNNCECEPRKEQNFCGKCRYLYRDFKYGLSCYRLMDNEPCKYEERKDEPTISKMEQVDKDINVRSKTEPQTDGYISGEDFMKIFDEPQTERSE